MKNKNSSESSHSPYRFIERATNFNVKYGDGQFAVEQYFTHRPIEDVERRFVNDTNAVIAIFNGEVDESNHYANNRPEYEGPIDSCIYLDKSARPVCDIISQLWTTLSPTDINYIPSPSFLNIDKEDFSISMGEVENIQNPDLSNIDINRMDPGYLKRVTSSIRAQYLSREDLEKIDEGNFNEEVWNFPTVLDGKHVAILDEVKSSGATLEIAKQLIDHALLGKAKLEPIYWSVPARINFNRREGNEVYHEFAAQNVPPWYDSDTSDGRYGINNNDPEVLAQSSSKRERLGRYILSVSRALDDSSKLLQQDIAIMVQKTKDRQIPVTPIPHSRVSAERISQFYGGIPFKDLREAFRNDEKWRKKRIWEQYTKATAESNDHPAEQDA